MIGKIDHVAVAVENLDEALTLYEKVLGLRATHREYVADHKVEVATIPLGSSAIELIEGKSADSPIRRFIEKRGPGLHHLGLLVPDIRAALEELRKRGVPLIDEEPRRGKENSLVAFIHPRGTQKVLFELVEIDKTL